MGKTYFTIKANNRVVWIGMDVFRGPTEDGSRGNWLGARGGWHGLRRELYLGLGGDELVLGLEEELILGLLVMLVLLLLAVKHNSRRKNVLEIHCRVGGDSES